MAFISAGVEYALHCLLYLDQSEGGAAPSSRELGELQGISATYTAKLFTRLQKAGIVRTSEGLRGGIKLARDPATITVNDVVCAIDGEQPLFECREIRRDCALFGNTPPAWSTEGVCGIHAVMRRAERAMRDSLSQITLAQLSEGFARKAPPDFAPDVRQWLEVRNLARARRKFRSPKLSKEPLSDENSAR